MQSFFRLSLSLLPAVILLLGSTHLAAQGKKAPADPEFQVMTEQFADIKILRYQIPAWDKLSLQQKQLVYYLTQAGLAGRDIIYDQNYRHNLPIRRALEKVYNDYQGQRSGADWEAFEVYLKRIWFSNGIHHHYSYEKFEPGFRRDFLTLAMRAVGASLTADQLKAIFDPAIDSKKVNKDGDKDVVLASAVNFYDPDITQKEVEAFYEKMKAADQGSKQELSYGLNSKLVKGENGMLEEKVYSTNGMYGRAIGQMVQWLELAAAVAENDVQAKGLKLLIDYYNTGDLSTWDDYNVVWVQDTEGIVDYIHGFIEVYNDPLGLRGSYESLVEIRDLDASAKMKVLSENAQYFEDNSPISDKHKKANVVGITYNFINVAGEAGDASPSTPIGVNLPNANWIRAEYGSKSVSLGNIVAAYEQAGTSGFLEEFSNDPAEIEFSKNYGKQAAKLHTALHEVIGHASGQINPGVGTPKSTLKNYASTIEEARADLVALYYIMDPQLVKLGVMDNMDVAKAAYDDFMKNGLFLQLRRLKPGEVIEEDHMRNRQLIAGWAYEKAVNSGAIIMDTRDQKTYFDIVDYQALRGIFGTQLLEIQRITSEGDYAAAKALVEKYGVQVDKNLHAEVLKRVEQFNSAPYSGFINPVLVPVEKDGKITDVKVEYPDDFTKQMIEYGKTYSTLKGDN